MVMSSEILLIESCCSLECLVSPIFNNFLFNFFPGSKGQEMKNISERQNLSESSGIQEKREYCSSTLRAECR
jgi:hypothetical protein